jgi:hypothetical protein
MGGPLSKEIPPISIVICFPEANLKNLYSTLRVNVNHYNCSWTHPEDLPRVARGFSPAERYMQNLRARLWVLDGVVAGGRGHDAGWLRWWI